MNLDALGLGTRRLGIRLDFAAKSANAGSNSSVIFSFWPTKNCQLLVEGFIYSGQWPLLAGSPGSEVVVRSRRERCGPTIRTVVLRHTAAEA